MSLSRDRSLRLRRLFLEDTISSFSVCKDFVSGDDRSIQSLGFSDLHAVASDGNRIATLSIDEFCNEVLISVGSNCGYGGGAHVWLRGRALSGKTWITLRVILHFAQAALDQLCHLEATTLDLEGFKFIPLPLFIPALKLARSRPSTVESYIRSCHGLDTSDELVRFLLQELEVKRVMLFIDGLDDITRHRPLVVKHIEDVLLPSHPCVFMTSRGEAIHWLSPTAFPSSRIFTTDVASFDPHIHPIFLEGMSSNQLSVIRYLLSLKFNLPPYDVVTSHSPGQPLIDCVGGLAIACSIVLRDATVSSSMSIVVQLCETYLRELLFAADSRKFVLISSDVDAERGRDQRLLGSPACLALLEAIASLATQKTVGFVDSSNFGLPPVQFSDEDVSSVIESNPQFGGIWSCLFKSSPVIHWGPLKSTSLPIYTFSHPFLFHLLLARATASRLHAGESIPWLMSRRMFCSREHRGHIFMLAAMLRCESFVSLVSSLVGIVPSYRTSFVLLSLAMTSHRPISELQSTDMKSLIASLKANFVSSMDLSTLILHSVSPCLRTFAINIVRVCDTNGMLSIFAASLALIQAVSTHALAISGDTTSRVLACIHFLLKFVDDMSVMSPEVVLDCGHDAIESLSLFLSDVDQIDCVRAQGIQCIFAFLTSVMRVFPSIDAIEYDSRLIFCITVALNAVNLCEDIHMQTIYCYIKLVPFLSQVIVAKQLHEQACLLIRLGFDDVRLFPSIAFEFCCSQHHRRLSAALAATRLCFREDMRSLILAHLRDSSRSVRTCTASALKMFPQECISTLEFHNISHCLCVSLILESIPEVVAALLSTLASIFPRLVRITSAVVDAMLQHPAVLDLLSSWVLETQKDFSDVDVVNASHGDSFGPEFLTLNQILHQLQILMSRNPPPPPSVSCKLHLLFAIISSSSFCCRPIPDSRSTEVNDVDAISSYLVEAAASVGLHSSPVASSLHSCTCSFIRSFGSRLLAPVFLRIDVPQLLCLAGIRSSESQCPLTIDESSNQVALESAGSDVLLSLQGTSVQQVSFSLQKYFLHEGSQNIQLHQQFQHHQRILSRLSACHQPSFISAPLSNSGNSNESIRTQLANEFILELLSAVCTCIELLPQKNATSFACACKGVCAYCYFILISSSTFELGQDLLSQTLSLVSLVGILAVHLAMKMLNFNFSPKAVYESVFRMTSHSCSRVRVAAVQVLSKEWTALLVMQNSPGDRIADAYIAQFDVNEVLGSIRQFLLGGLVDDSEIVVSAILDSLVSVVRSDAEFCATLYAAVASSLKEALTLCLSRAEGRSKTAAKVNVLLKYIVAAFFSDLSPALHYLERTCVEIRRICKWFPSSHKPPRCAQPLRLQAVKAAASLLSCKRLYSQGTVRSILIDAVEGAASALNDSVSLATVDIAIRHRLFEGQQYLPILSILREFDSLSHVEGESQNLSCSFLKETLAACALFDSLPTSIIEHLFSISFNSFPLIDQDFKIFVLILSFVETRLQSEASVGIWAIGDGIAVETNVESVCQWMQLMFKNNVAGPAFDWIVRWCNRAALQPHWLLPIEAQALLEQIGSSRTDVNTETKLFMCLAICQGWLCDLHKASVNPSGKWWSRWMIS